MDDPQLDSEQAHLRDLADVRQLRVDQGSLRRGSAAWLELDARQAILTRKIREWAAEQDTDV